MKKIQKGKTRFGVRAYCWLQSLRNREEGFVSAEHLGYAVAGLIIIGGILVAVQALMPNIVSTLLDRIGVGGGS